MAAPTPRLSQAALLEELEPVVAVELDRHLRTAKDWYPHEYVPWSEGSDYSGPLDGQPWDPAQSQVDEVARTALVVNLLTEDNLPSYHREIDISFGRDGAWGTWVGRWTAEEARHGQVMRDYMLVTRAVDPAALEDERLAHMTAGFRSAYPHDLQHGVAYVSFQELATRISHRNTGRHTGDPRFEALLARIAADENLHMIFYRNLLGAALELSPNQAMAAIRDVVTGFQMPGTDIPGFQRKAVEMAVAGIYDLRIHRDDVVAPVLRFWKIWDLEGLDETGESARQEVSDFMDTLETQASRFEDKRDTLKERMKIG